AGITQITVKVWGAGGGGRDGSGSYSYYPGGSGGYAEADMSVTPGENLVIVVGGGGQIGAAPNAGSGGNGGWPGGGYGTSGDAPGGGGGGVVGVFRGSYGHANSFVIAGSGGGAGYLPAGAGGGSTGGSGYCFDGNSQGGTQSAGGTGTFGADGSALQGGNGDSRGFQASDYYDGGGGGAGYYGGEGGYSDAGGGAGGSGFINSSYDVGSTVFLTGNQSVYSTDYGLNSVNPPNTTDPYYNGSSGIGYRTSNGGNGLVVIVLVPSLKTNSVSGITDFTATCGGEVTSVGRANATVRGVCWSTTQNPTLSNNFTTDGSGDGTFTSSITGLTPGVTYYARAYATNTQGTGYGPQVSFTTSYTSITWNGNTSADWNTASNWTPNAIPQSGYDVVIPNVAMDLIINESPASPAVCDNLLIQSGGNLTIEAGSALTVLENLNNSGTIAILSPSNMGATGSIITNGSISNTGTMTIQRWVSQGTTASDNYNWHSVGIPFASTTAGTYFT
ncbi:MAG: hypothetical protein J0653_08200, partial [Deltaproteobacteria bacterium]|nr:hypothetical protein [Deltaproteobacteria bacterium]